METNANGTRLHVTAHIVIDRPDESRALPAAADALEITGRGTQAGTSGGWQGLRVLAIAAPDQRRT